MDYGLNHFDNKKNAVKEIIGDAICNKLEHHGFNEDITENQEMRNMVQIGG